MKSVLLSLFVMLALACWVGTPVIRWKPFHIYFEKPFLGLASIALMLGFMLIYLQGLEDGKMKSDKILHKLFGEESILNNN